MTIWEAVSLSCFFALLMTGLTFAKRQKYAGGRHSGDGHRHGKCGDGYLYNEVADADKENCLPAQSKRWESRWFRAMIKRRADGPSPPEFGDANAFAKSGNITVSHSESNPAARHIVSSSLDKSKDTEHDIQLYATVTYWIPANDLRIALQTLHSSYPTYWSHTLYRGPNGQRVIVQYCQTRAESEIVARSFLNEEVIGFDMEWKCPASKGLKNNISLIQIACEKQIALFHLAVHHGDTVDQLFAPSLRAIIESPKITKVGVAILNADGARLKRVCGIEPRGLFELSHLYKLVKYASTPEMVIKRLVSLATQVKEHLQLPLLKDSVRTSDWSKSLDRKQIEYAANDAYCGFMLFHVMEAKRKKLQPTPPRPAHAELYQPIRLADILQESEGPSAQVDDSAFRALEHRGHGSIGKICERHDSNAYSKKGPDYGETDGDKKFEDRARDRAHDNLDAIAILLFEALRVRRIELSQAQKVPALLVASDRTLEELARLKPCDLKGLKEVHGIGDVKASRYGYDWLQVIRKHVLGKPVILPSLVSAVTEEPTATGQPGLHRHRIGAAQQPEFSTGLHFDPPAHLSGVTPLVEQVITIAQPISSAAISTLLQHNMLAWTPNSDLLTPRSTMSTEPVTPAACPKALESLGCDTQRHLPKPSPGLDAVARQVFSALCALRIRLSQKSNIQREFIASDSTLNGLAARRPHDSLELKKTPGGSNFALLASQHGVDLLAFIEKRASAAQPARQPLVSQRNVQETAQLNRHNMQEETAQGVELIDLTGDDSFTDNLV